MTLEELEKKYAKIPLEIKQTRRWIGYKIENRDGKDTKVPYNAISGDKARSNDSSTWTNFKVALLGYIKYKFDGIGFMLGEDKNTGTKYFGVDLDNHESSVTGNKPMTDKEFEDFINKIVNTLNSYAEYSHSGEGVHIICKGSLPDGRRKSTHIEMYDKGRFFTMTGQTILNVPIQDRTLEVIPVWEEYLKREEDDYEEVNPSQKGKIVFGYGVKYVSTTVVGKSQMSDDELIDKILSSTKGTAFNKLYNGNISDYQDDHSKADMALCQILAFWTRNDKEQIDRIFRRSGLMRKKWDTYRGDITYGEMTINEAIRRQTDTYTPKSEKTTYVVEEKPKKVEVIESNTELVEFDELDDPIIKVKKILTDTGNAERFYDYFGEYF